MRAAPIHPVLAAFLADGLGRPVPNPTPAEWETILDQALAHGLTFWLQGFPGLPESLQERVSQECLGITARNLAVIPRHS